MLASRPVFAISGGIIGFGLGLQALMEWAATNRGPKGLLFLLAGTLFGAIAGLDMYSTRNWTRFGKHTYVVRATLACSGAGAVTAIVGVVVGLVPQDAVWLYSAGGAILGAFFGVRTRLDVGAQLPNEELEPKASHNSVVE